MSNTQCSKREYPVAKLTNSLNPCHNDYWLRILYIFLISILVYFSLIFILFMSIVSIFVRDDGMFTINVEEVLHVTSHFY